MLLRGDNLCPFSFFSLTSHRQDHFYADLSLHCLLASLTRRPVKGNAGICLWPKCCFLSRGNKLFCGDVSTLSMIAV